MGGESTGVEADGRHLALLHQDLIKPQDAFMESTLGLAETEMMNPRATSLFSRAWRLESCFLDGKSRVDSLEAQVRSSLDSLETEPEEYDDSDYLSDALDAINYQIYSEKEQVYLSLELQVRAGISERLKCWGLGMRMRDVLRRVQRSRVRVQGGTQDANPDLSPETLDQFMGLIRSYCRPRFVAFEGLVDRFLSLRTAFYTRYNVLLKAQNVKLKKRLKRYRAQEFNQNWTGTEAKRRKRRHRKGN